MLVLSCKVEKKRCCTIQSVICALTDRLDSCLFGDHSPGSHAVHSRCNSASPRIWGREYPLPAGALISPCPETSLLLLLMRGGGTSPSETHSALIENGQKSVQTASCRCVQLRRSHGQKHEAEDSKMRDLLLWPGGVWLPSDRI